MTNRCSHTHAKKEKKELETRIKIPVSLIEFFCREKKKKEKRKIPFSIDKTRVEIGDDRPIDRRGNEGKSPGIGCELARFLAGLKESAADGGRTTQRRAKI